MSEDQLNYYIENFAGTPFIPDSDILIEMLSKYGVFNDVAFRPEDQYKLADFFDIDGLVIPPTGNIDISIARMASRKRLNEFMSCSFYNKIKACNNVMDTLKQSLKHQIGIDINRINRTPFSINSVQQPWSELTTQNEDLKQKNSDNDMFCANILYKLLIETYNFENTDQPMNVYFNIINKFAFLICQDILNFLLTDLITIHLRELTGLDIMPRNPIREYLITITPENLTMRINCNCPLLITTEGLLDVSPDSTDFISFAIIFDIRSNTYIITDLNLKFVRENVNPGMNPVASGNSRFSRLRNRISNISLPTIPRPNISLPTIPRLPTIPEASKSDYNTIVPAALVGSAYLLGMPFLLGAIGGKKSKKSKKSKKNKKYRHKFTKKYNKNFTYKKLKNIKKCKKKTKKRL
jgi:hypothetical protein